jgi:NarL family two-component system response regulator LiaR
MDPIRVVLVDDHRIVRRGLRSFLEAFPDLVIVGESSSGEEALEQVEGWLPDVVIMDLLMPGGIDGIETTRRVRSITPHTQIVVLTAHTDDARVMAALRAGAIGYVRKDAEPEILLAAVRAAARGQSMLDPAVAGTVLQDLVSSFQFPDPLFVQNVEHARRVACRGPAWFARAPGSARGTITRNGAEPAPDHPVQIHSA